MLFKKEKKSDIIYLHKIDDNALNYSVANKKVILNVSEIKYKE